MPNPDRGREQEWRDVLVLIRERIKNRNLPTEEEKAFVRIIIEKKKKGSLVTSAEKEQVRAIRDRDRKNAFTPEEKERVSTIEDALKKPKHAKEESGEERLREKLAEATKSVFAETLAAASKKIEKFLRMGKADDVTSLKTELQAEMQDGAEQFMRLNRADLSLGDDKEAEMIRDVIQSLLKDIVDEVRARSKKVRQGETVRMRRPLPKREEAIYKRVG